MKRTGELNTVELADKPNNDLPPSLLGYAERYELCRRVTLSSKVNLGRSALASEPKQDESKDSERLPSWRPQQFGDYRVPQEGYCMGLDHRLDSGETMRAELGPLDTQGRKYPIAIHNGQVLDRVDYDRDHGDQQAYDAEEAKQQHGGKPLHDPPQLARLVVCGQPRLSQQLIVLSSREAR
jgi:hypothetical protein